MDIVQSESLHMKITGPINLGNPNEFTITELAEKVLAKTGSSSCITIFPLPSDDPIQRKPDIDQAKIHLKEWTPLVSLDVGLQKTIDYFKHLNNN
jgi:UDP-glucuronate decarboxylase